MKLSKFLFKPKWQDNDAAVRRSAITADTSDGELAAALPDIARRDEDAGVRLAALQRLADYEAWRERSTGDADGTVRNTAREAYLALLCAGGPSRPPHGMSAEGPARGCPSSHERAAALPGRRGSVVTAGWPAGP